jgi:hypothetical protein
MGPETIRNRALECLWLAQNSSDPEQKSLLLTMAHSWADLANSVERFQLLTGGTARIACSAPILVKMPVAPGKPEPPRRSRLH